MLRTEKTLPSGARFLLLDSITKIEPRDAGAMVIAASHGGSSSCEFALAVPLKLVVFNDAGVGKDDAGIVALAMLQARGVAAATVSHQSARIGDARDMWENGVISHVNDAALAMGLHVGTQVRQLQLAD